MRFKRLAAFGISLAILLAAQVAAADTFPAYLLEGRWFEVKISATGLAGPPAFQEQPLVKTKFQTVYYMYFDFESLGGAHYDLIMVWEDSPGVWTSHTISDYMNPIYQYGEFGEAYQLPQADTGYNFYDPDGNDIDLFFTGMIVLKPDTKVFGFTKGATVYMTGVTNDGLTPDGSLRSATVKIKAKQVVKPGEDPKKLPFDPLDFIP